MTTKKSSRPGSPSFSTNNSISDSTDTSPRSRRSRPRVKKLKELVRLRNEKRREIVAKRLEQVLRDAEGLGW